MVILGKHKLVRKAGSGALTLYEYHELATVPVYKDFWTLSEYYTPPK